MNNLLIALALVIVAFLVYKLWKPVFRAPKQEVPENKARLYFFFTNWCGFSKKAMPEWEKLEAKLKTSGYYGKTHVEPVRVDCEADQKTCSLYEIRGYPTVLLETKEGIYDYTQRPTVAGLQSFLTDTLGKERDGL